jgi:hypothetical protein
MARWANPSGSTWTGEFQFVCFNDECPYFVRGWEWMKQSFSVGASYRFRLDPETGETGALAVWSKDALKSSILAGEGSARVE